MCTVLLPPGDNPIAVNKYIIYRNISCHISCHIISYHVISYHIVSYLIISYHTISCHIYIYHVIPYHISYHIIPYHVISYHISYLVIPYIISYSIPYHIITYHIIPYRIIYIISCHTISYHIISYHILSYRSCNTTLSKANFVKIASFKGTFILVQGQIYMDHRSVTKHPSNFKLSFLPQTRFSCVFALRYASNYIRFEYRCNMLVIYNVSVRSCVKIW